MEEWTMDFDFDKMIENMRDAELPDELVDGLEAEVDDMVY